MIRTWRLAAGWLLIIGGLSTICTSGELVPAVAMDGRAALEGVEVAYRAAESYSHACAWSETTDGDALGMSPFRDGLEHTSVFQFRRPDQARLGDGRSEALVNGDTVWVLDLEQNEYTMKMLTGEQELSLRYQLPGFDMAMMTAFSLLDDGSGGGGCSTSVVEFDEEFTVTIETWNGEPGRRLSWAFSDGDDLTDFSNSLWISDRTGAIHHWKIQRSFESWGESGGTEDEPFSWSSTLEISCSEVQLNPALGPVDFRFTPPDGAIEVETSPSRWLDEQLPWEERTAATITLAEGSVEDLSPELLVSIHQTRIGRLSNHSKTDMVDVTGDGVLDLLITNYEGALAVVDGSTGHSNIIRFQGRSASGSTQAVLPVAFGAETAWLVQTSHYDRDPHLERSLASLHDPEGEELWTFSPELPEGLSSRMRIASGDLTGDGTPEVVVAVILEKRVPYGDRGYSMEDLSTLLAVLDLSGRRLSQQVLSTGVAAVHVHQGVGGAPSQIWCVTENGLEIIELAR